MSPLLTTATISFNILYSIDWVLLPCICFVSLHPTQMQGFLAFWWDALTWISYLIRSCQLSLPKMKSTSFFWFHCFSRMHKGSSKAHDEHYAFHFFPGLSALYKQFSINFSASWRAVLTGSDCYVVFKHYRATLYLTVSVVREKGGTI